ncbi:MATE family efflux transporter [Natronolimnohabitans innermongolicus]|uniref:Multidrug-efflux transporter n=1 Tax=Natronolimnohabitans innermongolicus JCM 12255 TaxID=1227499 RepID=L9WNB2_9EURY|nr:MATE family efflux transporter [Natronolimnohabitans innermongolicus]ELY50960.1 MATE efflux family protein [Natronolimnohabitans innermongolicus JCM 12255]
MVTGLLRAFLRSLAGLLERANVIERSRLRATVDLAWPRIVTGLARMSKQTADVAMVGLVLGPSAIAGLAFAYAYWQLGDRISLGLSGGSISLVSQHYGADEIGLANRTITQSYLIATALSVPLAALFYWQAEFLIGIMSSDPDAIQYGATYLLIVAPAIIFEFYNKVASRIFAGIGDTFTPMLIRGGGAAVNIGLNAVLIFGLGMGVAGAAIGTAVSTALITLGLFWGLAGKPYPNRDALPVGFTTSGPLIDPSLLRPLISVSTPLIFQQIARAAVAFPLLAIAAIFGSVAVAGYEIARRTRDQINSLSWGFSIASSSLVGRHIGSEEEDLAAAYGDEIIRFSLLSYVVTAVLVIIFAEPIARLFVTDPDVIDLAATFVAVTAVATIGLGLDEAATGALRGAGDTRWPFYAALVGLYVFALPIAYLGVVTPLGVTALYLSLVAEMFIPATITLYRYYSGAWRDVSRSLRDRSQSATD